MDHEARFSFGVEGMTCSGCSGRVEEHLSRVDGVSTVAVNLATQRVYVVGSPGVTMEQLRLAVARSGYRVAAEQDPHKLLTTNVTTSMRNLLMAVAGTIPLMALMILNMKGGSWTPFPGTLPGSITQWSRWVELVLGAAILLVPGWGVLRGATIAAVHRHVNMDTLISLGGISAWATTPMFLLGIGESSFGGVAAMLITLHLAGRHIEARLKLKSSGALHSLMSLQTREVSVISRGTISTLPVEMVAEGEVILVRAGERIPLDGSVQKGSGWVDESMLSGEPIPKWVEAGGEVVGGTVLQGGLIELQVRETHSNGYLARMIRLIQEAQSSKIPIQAVADRVAGIFVPTILTLATIAGAGWIIFFPQLHPLLDALSGYLPWIVVPSEGVTQGILVFVSTLVISCPCALGLAAPMGVVIGSGVAARRGILFKSGEVLQKLSRIGVIMMDKTGTLTEGAPKVIRYSGDRRAHRIAVALERNSIHPLAEAIRNHQLEPEPGEELSGEEREPELSGIRETSGTGMEATCDGELWRVGSPGEADIYKKEMEAGCTVVEVRAGSKVRGSYVIADPLRQSAGRVVEWLAGRGITPVMVTGDSSKTAHAVADRIGIERVHAEMSPEGKLRLVEQERQKGEVVAMVGDGINDAAALKAADIGLAMGSGSDLALEGGDLILYHGNLARLPEAIETGKRTFRTIKINLFNALFYNVIAIPMAMAGLMHPLIGEVAMSLSSIMVIINSLLSHRGSRRRAEMVLPSR